LVRKIITVVYLRESNTSEMRKLVIGTVQGAILYYPVDDQCYKSSKIITKIS